MKHKVLFAAVIAALAGGCSNSGNDCAFGTCGGVGGIGGPGGGTMTVTGDTALAALREAWFAASSTADIPFFVAATNIGDTSGGLAGLPVAGGVSKLGPGAGMSSVPFNDTYNCPVSGQFNASGDIADPLTITPGDIVTYQATACDSGTGYTVDGEHTLEIASVNGDVASGMYEQGQILTFVDFQAVTVNSTTVLNGDHSALIDTRQANIIGMGWTGSSLIIGTGQESVSIQAYAGNMTLQTIAPFTFTLDVAGNGNSSLVQGSFDYSTDETMVMPFGGNPSDGILEIFGQGGSTARVAVVDDTLVRIQVDANGSTNYEISVDVSWPEFLTANIDLTAITPVGH